MKKQTKLGGTLTRPDTSISQIIKKALSSLSGRLGHCHESGRAPW
jgi:hypothetical protein